jgi:Fe-S oxidoreductase
MQTIAIVVSLIATAVAVVLGARAVAKMLGVIRIGQPAGNRSDAPGARVVTVLKETVGHTRMLQWTWIGILHWWVFAAFILLTSAVAAGYVQLFDPYFEIPVVGTWWVYGWAAEFLGLLGTVGIAALIVYRQVKHPRQLGRRSRFFGSNFWQAYFVEGMVLLESAAILFIRGAEYKLHEGNGLHFPLSQFVGKWFYPDDVESLKNIVFFVAMIKITSAMIWLMVISTNLTMGVAWHRFTAWFNIFFKREASGRTALGAMKPLTSGGKAITLDDVDDLDEESTLGVGKVEDFSWKGILDFTTCTECGRCQSQCPAWNTEKPLSPKLLIMGLRDHAYAKAPYVQAGGEESEAAVALLERDEIAADAAGRSLIGRRSSGSGSDEDQWFYNPEGGDFVIDEDVLWSCTSCGACVQQCPVDIEHVDHIMDMRRYQLLVESNFPAELNQLFKGLENKGNPWNMSPNARMDWAKDLDFDVPVVGEDLESLESVDWLFWVGCAGAYEDRAKKTTRAVAELLDIAGISFGVLGNGETCTGDPARRAGNEFVFQGLAQQNVETFKEFKVKKVVSTCAHCFNTLRNEYKDFGIELEVVHHTQLLNRLVREGKLTPVKEGAGAAKRSITYHDPCYLGRHNQVYSPPRELLQVLPGAEYVEMERHSEKSFCCGAGGARMWMEENIGERINLNRTKEAVATGADQIAVGCPFCRVMLSDGLTAQQARDEAPESVEVLDVAQMLLASVKGEQATKLAPGETTAAPAAKRSEETRPEPAAGDTTQTEDTVTETADVGPAAKASGGSSLFDTPAPEAPATSAPASGGSLFDTPAPAKEAPAAEPAKGGSLFDDGGSLFDTPAPAAPKAESKESKESTTKAAESKAAPAGDLGSGGSLFDVAPTEAAPAAPASPAAAAPAEAKPAEQEPAAKAAETKPAPTADLGAGGSLFDIPAAEPATPAKSQAEPGTKDAPAPEGKTEDAPAPEAKTEAAPAPAPAATEPAPAEEPAPAATAPSAAAPATSTGGATSEPRTDVDITAVSSLFDIEAPALGESTATAPAVAAVPTATDAATADTPTGTADTASTDVEAAGNEETETVASPGAAGADATFAPETDAPEAGEAQVEALEAEAGDAPAVEHAAQPTGEEVSQAASAAAGSEVAEAATPAPADAVQHDAPADQAQPEQAEPVAPASSGRTHTPRTDVDINGAESLFDL